VCVSVYVCECERERVIVRVVCVCVCVRACITLTHAQIGSQNGLITGRDRS